MSGETTLTIIGNLTDAPELREVNGQLVANFTVASTPRVFDRQANQWKDGAALFLRCALWRDAADNVAQSLSRGSRVIVTGKLSQRSYENRQGEKRTVLELAVDEIGVSLKYAVAKPIKRSTLTGARSGGQATAKNNAPRGSDDPFAEFQPEAEEA
ncbi:single-stranded DNA-binding protein [Nocardia sp. CDC153]|uniref:single-stranded DNA-binding protein n=1 Tax=Nocardia sp. CDC153 TaxID=3112167 RepID=UPI002DBC8503|nr:single-stranded DNA-binding protein [Nocardia sp. CDC153]MEC3953793.1 single-stranded DNA-binding protein [Nocardia sp. CDC153]